MSFITSPFVRLLSDFTLFMAPKSSPTIKYFQMKDYHIEKQNVKSKNENHKFECFIRSCDEPRIWNIPSWNCFHRSTFQIIDGMSRMDQWGKIQCLLNFIDSLVFIDNHWLLFIFIDFHWFIEFDWFTRFHWFSFILIDFYEFSKISLICIDFHWILLIHRILLVH